MKNKIIAYLNELEKEKDIKILFACETGSRAWGFPSPDSDFDIRMVYVHKKDWYLTLSEKKDNINRMLEDNEIDISGWDLRKSLRLLQKSNAALLERIQSPILYKADKDFLKTFNDLAALKYSRIATIHHYLSMSKKFIEELRENKTYKLKKFFYALRSATACKWILEKEEMPPIEFKKMLSDLTLNSKLLKRIDTLIDLKATISESYLHEGENELLEFIETCIKQADDNRKSLPSSKDQLVDLDVFFRKIISENDH